MKKIIIIFLILTAKFLSAQVTQEWVATYPGTGSGYNFPEKSAIDKDGNFIVAGNSDSTHGYDYIVLKYNPSGNLIWKQRYNGTGNSYDYLIGMVLDDSGNVYVTGESDDGAALGGINWVTIKYNTNGQMKWKRSLNWIGNKTDEPFGMSIDKERNIYVVGFGITSSVYRQMVTIKYSSNGDSLWTKVYRTSLTTHDWGYSVVSDDSMNVYSSGYGTLPTGNEIVNIKYDQNGVEKWIEKYPTYYGDWLRPTYSAIDKENNLVVVGYSYISNNYDFVTLKYSTEGNLLWSRLFAAANDDYAKSIFLDDNNNILIGGSAYSIAYSDYLILKYSPNGDTLLIKMIDGGGLNTDQVHSIISDYLDNIYVTGFSQSAYGIEHYLTIKLNSTGDTLWSKTYRNAYPNSAYCINIDSNGSVYVSGAGGTIGGNSGIVTIKYSQLTGIIRNELLNFDNFELNNYPNPFNPSTIINYKLKTSANVELKVVDIRGNEINTFVNRIQDAGHHSIVFDGINLPSGIYFYSLFINKNLKETKRMLLIK
ncbi:MAG: T9SS type A sorting domain-containing protein [Ignavibacteria bacterium]|nr:T9SS type A sorting domain-containing protein [Ignavibacteria bacterium]